MILYVFLLFAAIWVFAAYRVLVHNEDDRPPKTPLAKRIQALKDQRQHQNLINQIESESNAPSTTISDPPAQLPSEKPTDVSGDNMGCIWPPVGPDGAYPCGSDHLPYTNLEVPKFWTPLDEDYPSWRSYVNGEETIFIMIASYRDFQCRETITSAFSRASHPERLFIGAVDQVIPGDIGCLDLEKPCSEDPNQVSQHQHIHVQYLIFTVMRISR
jgi:hypothetical protein